MRTQCNPADHLCVTTACATAQQALPLPALNQGDSNAPLPLHSPDNCLPAHCQGGTASTPTIRHTPQLCRAASPAVPTCRCSRRQSHPPRHTQDCAISHPVAGIKRSGRAAACQPCVPCGTGRSTAPPCRAQPLSRRQWNWGLWRPRCLGLLPRVSRLCCPGKWWLYCLLYRQSPGLSTGHPRPHSLIPA